MSRHLKIAAAQLGPLHRADTRSSAVERLTALLQEAHGMGAKFVVFPELAFTTFFPRWWMEDQEEVNRRYFEPRFGFLRGRYYTIRSRDRLRVAKIALSRAVEPFPETADDFEYYGDLWAGGFGGPVAQGFIEAAKRADVIAFNAENGIYRNSNTGMRGLFMVWYGKTRLGKPAGVINQTAAVAKMDRPIMRGIVKMLYPKLEIGRAHV